ncbi:MAG: hypothetical protein QME92_09375 [Bacillota bacterium]|nr:hypothetical protein [Bacillota bacterium]
MAPRKGTRRERGEGRIPEQAAALEAAIRQISGVASARVDCGPDGEVTGIDILVEKGVQSRSIVRDIESACAAHLDHRLPSEAISITREGRGEARRVKRRKTAPKPSEATAAADMTVAASGRTAEGPGRAHAGRATSRPRRDDGSVQDDVTPAGSRVEAPVVKKYRVVSGTSVASGREAKPRKGGRSREIGEEELRPEPRIGMKRLGVNVYPDRIHAMVELSYGPRTFVGEEDDLPNDDNRFKVPAAATLKALDRAFGGLVGLSVDDIQLCRVSGRETAVVLATIGSPWGDVPSTGASYVTRSEEEAVIRALLHAVNRCVTLTYGGEEYYEEDVG